LVPGLPHRRHGPCNEELVNEYQEIDVLKLQVEQVFLACMGDAINEELKKPALHELVHTEFIGKTRTGKCDSTFPELPEFHETHSCFQRVRLLQIHCRKIGECCDQSLRGDLVKCSQKRI
ncbi:unnamed protein product, partial [Enterobius vermicularis]|uniref:TAZ-type domain-containing protein n=1 Tax=Enterobius vermicularis TaxID=51028 RepID=A0A0N4V4E7_ENTVE